VICATAFDCFKRAFFSTDELNQKSFPAEPFKEIKEEKTNSIGAIILKPPNQNNVTKFILSCSFYTNTEKLFRTDNGGKFTCLNGLRAISMVWIIVAHTFKFLSEYEYFFLLSRYQCYIKIKF
jgi:hypothetical protein